MKHDALSGKSKPPNSETVTVPRTMDLFGHASNGRPLLWKRAVQVVPVSAFERRGRWIKSGHYVIDHNGDAVAVHCGNVRAESVSVQFMHEELTPYIMPRGVIEPMLLGKVVVSREQRLAVFEGRRLSDFFR
jgi:hypothetical protein